MSDVCGISILFILLLIEFCLSSISSKLSDIRDILRQIRDKGGADHA